MKKKSVKFKIKNTRKIFHIQLILLCLIIFFSCTKKNGSGAADSAKNELVIGTYDSFVSEWGPGEKIAERFMEKSGIRINWESSGDAGTLLSRLLLEGKNTKADIILGLDQNLADKALASKLFEAYKPKNAEKIIPALLTDDDFMLIPYDYSYFALIYDSEKIKNPPKSLDDLLSPAYKNALILMDPRTSSPGLGFLGWTITIYGDAWQSYWEKLLPSILTITAGWDTGYGLFTKGEAPLVLSYTTSPAYHLEYEGSERYRAALFPQGHPIQIEFAGLLEHAQNKDNARRFLDFMLTEDFQSLIPLANWMYPAIDMALPESYRINPKPSKTLRPAPVSEAQLDAWLDAVQ
ncbi:MAG: thiamine ABC transporter substrate-binding protein [Spirochaetaceae bacterium]|jgi:thiamine transport system substrate-binding protein|nr:thiamine ABC transporter substrate-binding protein [Spirochaetaceae bacterium]